MIQGKKNLKFGRKKEKEKCREKDYWGKPLHGVGHERKEWASFMKEPNGSHIFRTVSISSSFLGVFHRCQLTCSLFMNITR